jgi:hypothetical protein
VQERPAQIVLINAFLTGDSTKQWADFSIVPLFVPNLLVRPCFSMQNIP